MVAIKRFLILATVVGAYGFGINKRASQAVQTTLNDIEAVKTSVDKLTTGFDNYSGGFFAATPLVPLITAVDSAMVTAAKNAGDLSGLSLTDAASIIDGIAGLKDPVTQVLAALTSNAAALHTANLDFVAVLFLQNIKTDVDALANALIAQSPNSATMTSGKALLNFFDQAIKTTAQGFNNPLETLFTGVGQLFGPPSKK